MNAKQPPNNAINTDSVKRREKHAPLYAAGYGERSTDFVRSAHAGNLLIS
jgi:hypothetical protein